MKLLLKLYWAFFKIGLFTFGGGYAMLPLMEREAVDNNAWVTREEMLDIYALSQCTPGVIAVNTATFIGRKEKGFLGALISTLGVITPSLIIISLIAAFVTNFAENPYVVRAFMGIRVAVSALIIKSIVTMGKKSIKNPAGVGVAIAALLALTFLGAEPVVVMVVCVLFGIFLMDMRPAEVKTNE